MNWKSTADIYTPPCVKQMASGKQLFNRGSPAQCSVMTQMGELGWALGGRLKKKGMSVYLQLIHIVVQQKPTQHCKAIILQLKKCIGKKNPGYFSYNCSSLCNTLGHYQWITPVSLSLSKWKKSLVPSDVQCPSWKHLPCLDPTSGKFGILSLHTLSLISVLKCAH